MEHSSDMPVPAGRSLLADRETIKHIVKDFRSKRYSKTEYLKSGAVLKGHFPANYDIQPYTFQAPEVAYTLLFTRLSMHWIWFWFDQFPPPNFMHDMNLFTSKTTGFMKGYHIHVPKLFYSKSLFDHLQQETVATLEMAKLGSTSIVRHQEWRNKKDNQMLAEVYQIEVCIDRQTRRPIKFADAFRIRYAPLATDPNMSWKLLDNCPDEHCKKIAELQHLVTDKDLDINKHLNAFVYHLLCYEVLLKGTNGILHIKDFVVNYKKETLKGEVINVTLWKAEPNHYLCDVWKETDQGKMTVASAEIYLYDSLQDITSSKL